MIKRTYPQTRLRRTRSKSFLRDLIAENNLNTDDLIQPIFIADQSEDKIENVVKLLLKSQSKSKYLMI